MDFDLPEELVALKDAVADFATRRLTDDAEAYERSGEFAYELIREMGAAGFFGAPFPEELGGSAAGFLAVSVIAEEISRIAPAYGYAMNMQCATCPYTIYNWGTPEQVERFVPGLINLGLHYLNAGKLVEAEQKLAEALALQPNSPKIQRDLSRVRSLLGRK